MEEPDFATIMRDKDFDALIRLFEDKKQISPNVDQFKKLCILRKSLGTDAHHTEAIDFLIFKSYDLFAGLSGTEEITKFVTEFENFLNGEKIDLLFMLDFIAITKDRLATLKQASRNNQNRIKSQQVKLDKQNAVFIALRIYFEEIEKRSDAAKPGAFDLESAIADVWDANEDEIKKIKPQKGEKIPMTLGAFSARFNVYLNLCREKNNGKTILTGRTLKKRKKS